MGSLARWTAALRGLASTFSLSCGDGCSPVTLELKASDFWVEVVEVAANPIFVQAHENCDELVAMETECWVAEVGLSMLLVSTKNRRLVLAAASGVCYFSHYFHP